MVSCSKYDVPAEIQPYITNFENYSKNYGLNIKVTNLVVNYNTSTSEVAGSCLDGQFITPTITLNTTYWNTTDSTLKEIIMFHELGHCVLGRVHRLDIINGEPVSIMYPYILNDLVYQNSKDAYLKELYTTGNIPQR